MKETLFRQWIEAGYRTYGNDPWFFLRELGQNSRDAGATRVQVTCETTTSGQEILSFQDDGLGMTFSHARQFLFRLYASSKIHDKYSAGIYGIGFWTILRYEPEKILIQSRTRNQAWAMELDAGLQSKKIPVDLERAGTRVTLIRRSQTDNPQEFTRKVEEKLIFYCGFLRRNDRKSSLLPVYFLGKKIFRDFHVPGIISSRFKKGPVEGAVGFEYKPRVTLYARGLPVWEGCMLEELFQISPPAEPKAEIGQGLAPVFVLNGNNLDVSISRKTILENRALRTVKKIAESELEDLIYRHSDALNPQKPFKRFSQRWRRMGKKLRKTLWMQVLLVSILFIPLEIILLNFLLPSHSQSSIDFPAVANSFLQEEKSGYREATVSRFSRPLDREITYAPPVPSRFIIFIADQYNKRLGFIRSENQQGFGIARVPGSGEKTTISIQIKIPGPGKMFLPIPKGYAVCPEMVSVGQDLKIQPGQNPRGETFITIPEKKGYVKYDCCPLSSSPEIEIPELEKLTRLPPDLTVPGPVEQALQKASPATIEEKIQVAIELVRSNLTYDRSASTVEEYEKKFGHSDWAKKVFAIGKGDCDIISGITALFLRRMGIPSRVVIGLIGENGKMANQLHAWTEYYHHGWHTLDASASIPIIARNISGRENPDIPSRETQTSRLKTGLVVYVLIGLTIGLVLIFFRNRRKRWKKPVLPEAQADKVKEVLARIALGWMLHPGINKIENPISDAEIIPIVGGKFLSPRKALSLSQKGKLLVGSAGNPLAKKFSKKGYPVLNREDRAFQNLVKLIPNSIDLDMIQNPNPENREDFKINPLAKLLNAVNQGMRKIGKEFLPAIWCPGLMDQDYLPIRLPEKIAGFPRHFIAISPWGKNLEESARLYASNPSLAKYKAIKMLVRASGFFPELEKRLLKETALYLLKDRI